MCILINGRESASPKHPVVTITNPANGKPVGSIWKAIPGDETLVLDTAQEGFRKWSAVPLSQRADILMKYADLLEENRDRIAAVECSEMGKIITECTGEVGGSAYITRGFIEKAKHLYGKSYCDNHHGLERDLIFTRREPLGVFYCIVPFNYPVELYTHKVIPALIMGNAVIIKVPADNPLAMIEMSKLLVEAGVPPEAVGLLYCDRVFSTEQIVKSERIQAVSLTGSTSAGISILRDSADTLHKVFLELGGNDPFIIFEDADLDQAVEEILVGRVSNTGQTCCASKRFIVQKTVQDALVEKLIARLDQVKRGDPADPATQIGCILNKKNAATILDQIQFTVEQGAACVYGGTVKNDTFVEPTILTGVTKDMDISKDMEIFGPVIPIIPFTTKEEAVEIANQIPYGLQGGVMTANTMLALDVAAKLQCGSVVVNGSGNYRHMDMAFGGYKMTGIGREGVSATLEEFSQEKTFIIKQVLKD